MPACDLDRLLADLRDGDRLPQPSLAEGAQRVQRQPRLAGCVDDEAGRRIHVDRDPQGPRPRQPIGDQRAEQRVRGGIRVGSDGDDEVVDLPAGRRARQGPSDRRRGAVDRPPPRDRRVRRRPRTGPRRSSGAGRGRSPPRFDAGGSPSRADSRSRNSRRRLSSIAIHSCCAIGRSESMARGQSSPNDRSALGGGSERIVPGEELVDRERRLRQPGPLRVLVRRGQLAVARDRDDPGGGWRVRIDPATSIAVRLEPRIADRLAVPDAVEGPGRPGILDQPRVAVEWLERGQPHRRLEARREDDGVADLLPARRQVDDETPVARRHAPDRPSCARVGASRSSRRTASASTDCR